MDLDPQSNATQYLGMYSPSGLSSYDILNDRDLNIKEVIKGTKIENLDIIPANIKLVLSESEIIADTRRNRENRLKRALDIVKDAYDYCIIDCPPSLGMLTTNALVAATYVLVPIKVDKFALDGFEYLLSTIDEIKDEFNPSLKLMGAFVTMDKRTRINKSIKEELKEALGNKMLDSSIRDNVKVPQSTFAELPVMIYDEKSIAAEDYREFTEEVVKRVQGN